MSENVRFTAKQQKFIDWLSNPFASRNPGTQEALAVELGVDGKTLTRWKALPGFADAVQTAIKEKAGDDDAEIIQALKDSAKIPGKEGTADRRLYLQWRGQLVEKTDLNITVDPYSETIQRLTKERGLSNGDSAATE